MVTRPASSLVQDRESSPAETSVLTTMLRRHSVNVVTRCLFKSNNGLTVTSATLAELFALLSAVLVPIAIDQR